MSGQTFAGPSLDELTRRSAPSTPARRSERRRNAELGFGVSILLYLACVVLVGIATIGVSFGIGLYLLEHPTGKILAVAEARASSAPVTSAELPDATMTMATLAVLDRLGTKETQPGQTTRLDVTAQKFNLQPAAPLEPSKVQDGKHSEPRRLQEASTETVYGTVTEVPDAMTWIVGDQIVRLWGVRPGPQGSPSSLIRFLDWVRAQGPVECHRQRHSSRYQCSTANGEDIAEGVLFAGIGRAADGASLAYQGAEAQARRQGNGLWAKR